MAEPPIPFVSRGGLKLEAALNHFALDVRGECCADLGCNVGGFTDCLLTRGAAKVYAVDTGYGALAWKLRKDPRVVVRERTNALHADPVQLEPGFAGVALVVIDLGWTRQRHALPAAMRWLRAAAPLGVVSLIKPHYEVDRAELARSGERGVLPDELAQRVAQEVLEQAASLGLEARGLIRSPIRGGGARGREGNSEYLAWLRPRGAASGAASCAASGAASGAEAQGA